jgi:nucleoside-diphosphate-sugar epimerase
LIEQERTDVSELPNANFGRVLCPEHQGFPSTIGWARAAWTGERLDEHIKYIDPQWFISIRDTALLHISALIHGDVAAERLFGFAETFNFNQILEIFRNLYPERKFPENTEGLGTDRMIVPNQRAEEVLKWLKSTGWDSLETGLKEMSESWT